MEDGFEEAAAFGLGGGELRFQPVAQGHQFIHLGDDAVLFGEGWKWNGERVNTPSRRSSSTGLFPMLLRHSTSACCHGC